MASIPRTAAGEKPADKIIAALGGDARSGMAFCPAHLDQNKPNLHVSEGSNGKVLFHCFAGCGQAAVLDALRARRLWPVTGAVTGCVVTRRRSDEERREYALRILADTRANLGFEIASELAGYFARRGIVKVPATAMFAFTQNLDPYHTVRLVPADNMAMVFEVTDGAQVLGCHVTWLSNTDLTAKRDEAPVRQCFGPVGGGFIKLYSGELNPQQKLIIAEGVETAAAAAQIALGLPAIAALSAGNLPKINPPPASEYIIAADHDSAGLRGARALAHKLVRAGAVVRLAVPPRAGKDWNDVLLEREVL